jgi:hypothetical protein
MKNETPKAPEKESVAQNVRGYFTKDVNDQIVEMNLKEMEGILKEFINSREWIALLKYNSLRMPLLDANLRSLNPQTDAHKLSWSQGCLAGLCDIESYVIELNAPKPQQEIVEPQNVSGAHPEGVII